MHEKKKDQRSEMQEAEHTEHVLNLKENKVDSLGK